MAENKNFFTGLIDRFKGGLFGKKDKEEKPEETASDEDIIEEEDHEHLEDEEMDDFDDDEEDEEELEEESSDEDDDDEELEEEEKAKEEFYVEDVRGPEADSSDDEKDEFDVLLKVDPERKKTTPSVLDFEENVVDVKEELKEENEQIDAAIESASKEIPEEAVIRTEEKEPEELAAEEEKPQKPKLSPLHHSKTIPDKIELPHKKEVNESEKAKEEEKEKEEEHHGIKPKYRSFEHVDKIDFPPAHKAEEPKEEEKEEEPEEKKESFFSKITPSFFKGNKDEEKADDEDEPIEEEGEKEEKKGFFDAFKKPSKWFNRLKEGLEKTRKSFIFKVQGLFRLRNVIDEDFWEELEEILITSDVGLETTEYIVDQMKEAVEEHLISEPAKLFDIMKEKLTAIFEEEDNDIIFKEDDLTIILVVGVNGTGKTTSIAKLANRYMQQDKKVLVAAADTFRAAAIEQLEVWGRKTGLELIRHNEGSDPAAVVFDAVSAAKARNYDVLIIDTAGRLHSKVNLMKELEKINRVIRRNVPDGPHETLLVLDSTTGQNALIQARTFSKSVKTTGIILTKLDGTAKGGIIIGIVHELGIPVKFIGIGEGVYDLRPFEAKNFLNALFAEDEENSLLV